MGNTEIILYVVLTTLLMLLLIAGIVIAFFISNRQRAKQQVELVQTRLGYEKELRKVEAEVSEQLMLKFAQELHDNVGQLLTCMHLEVENRKIDHPSLEVHLRPIGQYIEDATNQLRLLSRSLNTEYVTHIGLRRAIEIEIERHRQLRKFTIEWQCGGDVSVLDKNQQLVVFRIFQEVLHNATRHSGARKVAITLVVEPNFELVILDDGKGFSPDRVFQSADASGLRNIMRRAAMAGLSCNLKTSPGEGCCYTLRLISLPTLSENNQALVHGK
jgi:two-component system, NarL family, sensor kinase